MPHLPLPRVSFRTPHIPPLPVFFTRLLPDSLSFCSSFPWNVFFLPGLFDGPFLFRFLSSSSRHHRLTIPFWHDAGDSPFPSSFHLFKSPLLGDPSFLEPFPGREVSCVFFLYSVGFLFLHSLLDLFSMDMASFSQSHPF